ncbi:isotocin receptor [Aplysia californica]|uniref:Isotocin receptor n=1 Tax=Aplysia californica TaxID=6500 RepID=A0ABM1ABB6_APLCA|nr:isotocin receptor [Aplysia californica]WGM83069.1 vasotocin receptor 1 [Aplysia californica]
MEIQLRVTAESEAILLLPTSGSVTQQDRTPDVTSPSQLMTSAGLLNESLGRTEANQSDAYLDRSDNLAKIEIAVLATILCLAVFGNAVVLLVLKLRRQNMSRMQWFIAHLAVADLFTAFFNVLPQLAWDITLVFVGNDFLCRTVKYLQVVAMYASSYVLVMAAIDRYMSICHPLTSQTLSPKRVNLMIAFAWLLSCLFSAPQLFIFSYQEVDDGVYDCYGKFLPGWGMQAYITWIFLTDYAIPFLVLAFCYGRICLAVWASVGAKESASTNNSCVRKSNGTDHKSFRLRILFQRKREHPTASITSRDSADPNSLIAVSAKPRGHQRRVSRSKIKTIKLTLAVVLCYLVCWAPFFVVQMWMAYEDDAFIEHPFIVVFMLLASLNSCTNPWIYLAFSGRSCPRGPFRRGGGESSPHPSTHVTSAGESMDSRTRSSCMDMSHGRTNFTRLPRGSSRFGSPKSVEKIANSNSKC